MTDTASEWSGDRESLKQPTQTPLFRATQAARYRRQEAIHEIEKFTGRKLICYVSGEAGYIERNDILPLMDLLHGANAGEDLDLLLHTHGGDVDAAEKISRVLMTRVGQTGRLRVIVPDHAKSAGTLICLAAQSIVMSDTSELGPIDPQIVTTAAEGNKSRPAQSYIDAYEDALTRSLQAADPAIAASILSKFDPVLVDIGRKALLRSRKLAESNLRDGMFRSSTGNWTDVAAKLNDNKEWLSHGAVINATDASTLGLTVKCLSVASNEWQAYWRLYCEMRLHVEASGKIFESNYASIVL